MTPAQLLTLVDPLLRSRCKAIAWKLPGVCEDDLYQECVYEFLRRVGGWMRQESYLGPDGQARMLAGFCVQNVRTAVLRDRNRWGELQVDGDGEIRGLDGSGAPSDDDDLVAVLTSVRDCAKPSHVLSFLSLRIPVTVELDDVANAKAYPLADFVSRPLMEAWEMFSAGRRDLPRVADDVAWKRDLGVAWCTTGPPEEVEPDEVRRAAGRVEKYSNLAAAALLKHLCSESP
jgi:hypothetical protein